MKRRGSGLGGFLPGDAFLRVGPVNSQWLMDDADFFFPLSRIRPCLSAIWSSPRACVWVRSPGGGKFASDADRRRNKRAIDVLERDVVHIAVAIARSDRNGYYYAVQMLGRTC